MVLDYARRYEDGIPQRVRDDVRRIPDSFTKAGADRHKRMIEEYWMKRGYAVAVRIETSACYKDGIQVGSLCIRSDLGLHLPPRSIK